MTEQQTEGRIPSVSRRRLLAGLAAAPVALAGCGRKGSSDPLHLARSQATTTVMIIRHGEKPDKSHPGYDEHGHKDPHSLTRRGWARARALPKLFDPPKGRAPVPGLMRPKTLYAATDKGPLSGGHRMRQTVTPLAQQLGIKLDLTFAESQEAALAKAAVAAPAPVLICWEHSRIPAIVDALGASGTGVPGEWPDRFDLVWVFTHAHGKWTFRQVNQHLLPGDA
ncbi:hypothetical protein [Streptomyces gilvosporeus]|uniref:Histidine phosphatase family protein n=1 Tax=Streptomyces gilvosporeus TaxID=553510 RepID=A0A1V0U0M6_9ACTN|nr:hypothetical protein [Streptomyces gilvosporeus]ARF58482.1 hypothetical protein B1H19_33665 [Streptomyces gilvosporeus]